MPSIEDAFPHLDLTQEMIRIRANNRVNQVARALIRITGLRVPEVFAEPNSRFTFRPLKHHNRVHEIRVASIQTGDRQIYSWERIHAPESRFDEFRWMGLAVRLDDSGMIETKRHAYRGGLPEADPGSYTVDRAAGHTIGRLRGEVRAEMLEITNLLASDDLQLDAPVDLTHLTANDPPVPGGS